METYDVTFRTRSGATHFENGDPLPPAMHKLKLERPLDEIRDVLEIIPTFVTRIEVPGSALERFQNSRQVVAYANIMFGAAPNDQVVITVGEGHIGAEINGTWRGRLPGLPPLLLVGSTNGPSASSRSR